MIQAQTYLNCADNTGARTFQCIRILGRNRQTAEAVPRFPGERPRRA